MTMARLFVAVCAAAGLTGPVAAYEKIPSRLARQSPADVIERIRVDEAQGEAHVMVSTKKVWDRGNTVGGVHVSDVHMRAVIDRATGAAHWELWHELDLYDDRREITGLTYRLHGRSHHAALVRSQVSEEICPSVDGPPSACHVRVRSVFAIPDRVLQSVAESYRPDGQQYWELEFSDSNGEVIRAGLAPVEVAGLRARVQQVRCQGMMTC